MSKTTDMELLEARDPQGRDIRTIIRDAYAKGGSLRGAGRILGVEGSTLSRWMDRLNLQLAVIPGEDREPAGAASR